MTHYRSCTLDARRTLPDERHHPHSRVRQAVGSAGSKFETMVFERDDRIRKHGGLRCPKGPASTGPLTQRLHRCSDHVAIDPQLRHRKPAPIARLYFVAFAHRPDHYCSDLSRWKPRVHMDPVRPSAVASFRNVGWRGFADERTALREHKPARQSVRSRRWNSDLRTSVHRVSCSPPPC